MTLSELDGGSFGAGRLPPDAWTAIRLLKEGADVTLKLTRQRASALGPITLTAPRARYLDDNGALARMFVPGELTQSLCSPWTHDFRDCACFYWASNHPDIALPPLPDPSVSTNDTHLGRDTAWERADRSMQSPPVATAQGDTTEMAYHEISRDWQLLNFVVERRERVTPYAPNPFKDAAPLADDAALLWALRYAAGVELGVMLQYLSAAWSLKKPNGLPAPLRDDVTTAFAEIRRIAIGEMRHLRAVNDVISQLELVTPYEPALAVASEIPDGKGGFNPLQFQPANPATIQRFLDIEAPSASSVDGLYAHILATLLKLHPGAEEQTQSICKIMSEGADHYQTFLFIQEWLGRHAQESDYLISSASPPPANNQAHKTSPGPLPKSSGQTLQRLQRRLAGRRRCTQRGAHRDARPRWRSGRSRRGRGARIAARFRSDRRSAIRADRSSESLKEPPIMAEQFWETVIFGAGPVGLVTALAAARSGSVLVMSPRVPQSARALRIDSVSLALMALFVELGLHPSEINAEETHDHRLAAWESKTPALIRSAATVYIERPLLEQSLMALARRHPAITVRLGGLPDRWPKTNLRLDATGRRAVSAEGKLAPDNPSICRTFEMIGEGFSKSQQALRIAALPTGYAYRIGTRGSLVIGVRARSKRMGMPHRRPSELSSPVGRGLAVCRRPYKSFHARHGGAFFLSMDDRATDACSHWRCRIR